MKKIISNPEPFVTMTKIILIDDDKKLKEIRKKIRGILNNKMKKIYMKKLNDYGIKSKQGFRNATRDFILLLHHNNRWDILEKMIIGLEQIL